MKKKQSATSRTLYYYWQATKGHLGVFLFGIITTLGFTFFLSFANPYVVGKIVDVVAAGGVDRSSVFSTFMPYIILLILSNFLGQVCSKAQDYSVWKLSILVYYDLSRKVFDTLSNQSMTFHNSRFGGALVSQTTKFTSAYSSLIETFIYAILPIAASAVFTIAILFPLVPVYVVILTLMMTLYVIVVYVLFARLQKMNAQTAGAQNRLSGELSDSITNILAVKTAGREDYERHLFEQANREVRSSDSRRMRHSLFNGATAAFIIAVTAGAPLPFMGALFST